MDTFERNAARTLAIAYAAYLEAIAKMDHDSTACWSRHLLEAQRASGVTIIQPDALLYWLTGDREAIQRMAAQSKARVVIEHMPPPDDDNGPSPNDRVTASAPAPRKPSPGAANDLSSRASAFFGAR